MNRYRILTGIFCLLATGNVLAEEADTLKVVDVEEITVIAAPKENRKLREEQRAVKPEPRDAENRKKHGAVVARKTDVAPGLG